MGRGAEGVLETSKPDQKRDRDEIQKLVDQGKVGDAINRIQGAGPLANNIGPERTEAIRTALGLKEGDAAFFVAGDPDKFWKFSGLARTKLGEELNLIDKDRFELAWVVDFPMYEYNEEDKKIDFSHNPFSMPQGGLEALQTNDPLTIN